MEILILARAPDRASGIAFMAETGIAEEIDGRIVPQVEAVLSTSDDGWAVGTWTGEGEETTFEPRSGWFCNVKYYGTAAQMLTEGGDPNAPDLFDRAPGLLMLTEARTGKPMTWTALSDDPHPPGYENEDGIRLYDPALITTPANVFC
jgi:hypothetical protein